jgi:putative hemolysin
MQEKMATRNFTPIALGTLLEHHFPTMAKMVPLWLMRALGKLIHLEEINQFLTEHYHEHPMDFVRSVNSFFDLTTLINREARLISSLKGKPLIVANHPLGGPESLVLMEAVGNHSPEVKMVAKRVLTALAPLEPLLCPIPQRNERHTGELFKCTFEEACPIIMFPAGYCSRYLSSGHFFDYQWYPTFVKMARRSNRTILPIHIDGGNSKRFYRLSTLRRNLRIRTSLESLLLPDEMFKQRGTHITLTIGQPIETSSLPTSQSDWHWAQVIRDHVYTLGMDPDVEFDPNSMPLLPAM